MSRTERIQIAHAQRRARILRQVADAAANSSVAIGFMFLVDQGAGLSMGTPGGLAGLTTALALIAGGLAQIALPRRRRRHAPVPVAATPLQAEIETDLMAALAARGPGRRA